MSWQQLDMPLDDLDAETVEDLLLELGAVSVTLTDAADQPLLEPGPGETPLWDKVRLRALFAADADLASVLERLRTALGSPTSPKHSITHVGDEDWSRAWLKDFRPMRFGKRLWIVPGEYAPPDPAAVNILLSPGLAFGTGTHPTTALCLTWLDSLDLDNRDVLDFGCGSGILAIAALKLGAAAAWGVDNDPQALTASRDNAARNSVENRLRLFLPEEMPRQQFPVLVANILARPLVSLAHRLAQCTASGGRIALSGILAEQEDMIRAAYAPWFELEPAQRYDDWLLVTGRRKSID